MRTTDRIGPIALLLAGLLSCGTAAATDTPEPAALYHRFAIAPGGAWGDVSLALSPGQWRVGHPDGRPATDDELRATLASLGSVRIGGKCAGVVDGSMEYPCSFALSRLDVGGIAGGRFGGIAGDDAPTFAVLPAEGDDAAEPVGAGSAKQALRRVEVVASVDWPGAVGIALGSRLSFRFRGVPNALAPSSFDLGSGLVVLRGGRRTLQQPSAALLEA